MSLVNSIKLNFEASKTDPYLIDLASPRGWHRYWHLSALFLFLIFFINSPQLLHVGSDLKRLRALRKSRVLF